MTQAQRSFDTRKRLLRAAAEEITIHGYGDASLSAIGARLGLSKGVLAYHYPTKRSLAVDILGSLSELQDAARDAAAELFPEGGVKAVIAVLDIVRLRLRGDVVAAAAIDFPVDKSIIDLELDTLVSRWSEKIADPIQQGIDSGEIPTELSASEVADHVLAAHNGYRLHARATGQERKADYALVRLVFTGLGVEDVDAHVEQALSRVRETHA